MFEQIGRQTLNTSELASSLLLPCCIGTEQLWLAFQPEHERIKQENQREQEHMEQWLIRCEIRHKRIDLMLKMFWPSILTVDLVAVLFLRAPALKLISHVMQNLKEVSPRHPKLHLVAR